jgi:hypothetical protein
MRARRIGDWSACGQGLGAVLPCLCSSKSSLGHFLLVVGFLDRSLDNPVVVCVSSNTRMGRLAWYWYLVFQCAMSGDSLENSWLNISVVAGNSHSRSSKNPKLCPS